MRMVDKAAVAASVRLAFVAAAVSGFVTVSSAQAQTSLPQIDVQRAPRSGGTTANRQPAPAPEAAPAPAPVEESAYGEVQGYLANRSATGTKTDTPLRETPQSITVVTQDTIRDQGATNIQEALRYVAGVFADAYGSDTRGDYPRIRGQDPNIFLDGTQAVNSWLFNEWRPDPYTLSRVEVLRGPSSGRLRPEQRK
jgi:iron complex outermembrane recepter protein